VRTAVRDQLNALIEKHGLQDTSTVPTRPKRDRKTDLTTLTITVKGRGTLESVVGFMRDVAELPHLARMASPKIRPESKSRNARGPTMMDITVPVEVLIPPQHAKVGKLKDEDLVQPGKVVRHRGRDYSSLWAGTPFTPEPDYGPLKVDAGKDIRKPRPANRKETLHAKPSGGDRQYTCKWEPKDGLEDPDNCRTNLDISEAFDRTYVVTVTDGRGMTATDTLRVMVSEPPVARNTEPPKKDTGPPPPPPVSRWRDNRFMQLVMVLRTRSDAGVLSEAMVENARSHQTEYYRKGDDFDGGKLVALHPTGALVHRRDGYYIYPIGSVLDEDFNVVSTAADDYPVLKAAAHRMQEAEQKAAEEEAAREAAAREAAAKAAREAAQAKTGQAAGSSRPGSPSVVNASPDARPEGTTAGGNQATGLDKPDTSGTQPPAEATKAPRRRVNPPEAKPRGAHRPGSRRQRVTLPGRSRPAAGGTKPAAQGKNPRRGRPAGFKPRIAGRKPGQAAKTEDGKKGDSKPEDAENKEEKQTKDENDDGAEK
jgi:hypothetical protein